MREPARFGWAGLGWLWFVLGALFVAGVLFDVPALKALFRLFLEAESRVSVSIHSMRQP